MPIRLTFQFLGTRQLDRVFTRLGGHVQDLRPEWDLIHQDFLAMEKEQFATEGARSGKPWAPLSPAYARWKRRVYGPKPILERTGALLASLTEKGGAGHVYEPERLTLTMGLDETVVPYAKFHQHGTFRMPQRPPVAITEADRRRWVKIIQRGLIDDLRRHMVAS